MKAALILLCFTIVGCAAPPISLEERFIHVTFHDDDGTIAEKLWRWNIPIRPEITGPEYWQQEAWSQLEQISELTGLELVYDVEIPNLRISFSSKDNGWTCNLTYRGYPDYYTASIHIYSRQSAQIKRRCVAQEIGQAFGLRFDTDGRTDTAFSSGIGTDYLTEIDIQLFKILFDERLRAGMPRDEVLATLPEIVADVEAEQEAARQ